MLFRSRVFFFLLLSLVFFCLSTKIHTFHVTLFSPIRHIPSQTRSEAVFGVMWRCLLLGLLFLLLMGQRFTLSMSVLSDQDSTDTADPNLNSIFKLSKILKNLISHICSIEYFRKVSAKNHIWTIARPVTFMYQPPGHG